jgi:hypothetical protein
MPFVLSCPSCFTKLSLRDDYVGTPVRCGKCGVSLPTLEAALSVPVRPPELPKEVVKTVLISPASTNATPHRERQHERLQFGDPVPKDKLASFGVELGKVVETFGAKRILGVAGFFVAAVTVIILLAIWVEFHSNLGPGTKEAIKGGARIFGALLLGLLIKCVSVLNMRKTWVFTEDAVLVKARNKAELLLYWEDAIGLRVQDNAGEVRIEILAEDSAPNSPRRLLLTFDRRWGFDSDALSRVLLIASERTAGRVADEWFKAMHTGESRALGPFVVNSRGFSWKERSIAWSQIQELNHAGYNLGFKLKDGSYVSTQVSMLKVQETGPSDVGIFANLVRRCSDASIVA